MRVLLLLALMVVGVAAQGVPIGLGRPAYNPPAQAINIPSYTLGGTPVLPQDYMQPQPGILTQPILTAQQANNLIPINDLQNALNQRVANLGQTGAMMPTQQYLAGVPQQVGMQQPIGVQQPLGMGAWNQAPVQQPMGLGAGVIQQQQPFGLGAGVIQQQQPFALGAGVMQQQPFQQQPFQQQPFQQIGIQQQPWNVQQQVPFTLGQQQVPLNMGQLGVQQPFVVGQQQVPLQFQQQPFGIQQQAPLQGQPFRI